MEPYTFHYMLNKAVWGISIRITAKISSMSHYSNKPVCLEVTKGVWAKISEKSFTDEDIFFSEDERDFICQGIRIIGSQIASKSPYKEDSLVIFHKIEFNDCYYQPEALVPAVVNWFANALDIEAPEIKAEYNKQTNKYEFDY